MGHAVAGLLAVLEIILLCWVLTSFGSRLLSKILPEATGAERVVLGYAVGMACLSVIGAAFLSLGVHLEAAVPLVLMVGGAWSGREGARLVRKVGEWGRRVGGMFGQGWGLPGCLLVVGGGGVIGCLAPETGWDTGVYHFTAARLWAEEGRMILRPDIPLACMPAYMESLYTIGFTFGGEPLASLMNFSLFLGGLAFVRQGYTLLGGKGGASIASYVYLSSLSLLLHMGGGDVEMGESLFIALATYGLWRRMEGGRFRWVLLAGGGAGVALGVKYVAGVILGPLAAAWMYGRFRQGVPLRRISAELTAFLSAAMIMGGPWYLRNGMLFGDPFYPLFVPGIIRSNPGAFPAGWVWMLPAIFRYDLMVFSALGVFLSPRLKKQGWVVGGLLFSLGILVWTAGGTPAGLSNAMRFWIPSFLPLMVLGSLVLEGAWDRKGPGRILAGGVLFLSLAQAIGIHGARNIPKATAAAGIISRDAYLEKRINSYWAIRQAERNLRPGERILLVEQRAYYCRAPFLVGADIQRYILFDDLHGPEELRAFLERHSIKFIVWNHSPVARTAGFARMIQRSAGILEGAGVLRVGTREDCTLYRVS